MDIHTASKRIAALNAAVASRNAFQNWQQVSPRIASHQTRSGEQTSADVAWQKASELHRAELRAWDEFDVAYALEFNWRVRVDYTLLLHSPGSYSSWSRYNKEGQLYR